MENQALGNGDERDEEGFSLQAVLLSSSAS
jgi:hypothetical protein